MVQIVQSRQSLTSVLYNHTFQSISKTIVLRTIHHVKYTARSINCKEPNCTQLYAQPALKFEFVDNKRNKNKWPCSRTGDIQSYMYWSLADLWSVRVFCECSPRNLSVAKVRNTEFGVLLSISISCLEHLNTVVMLLHGWYQLISFSPYRANNGLNRPNVLHSERNVMYKNKQWQH